MSAGNAATINAILRRAGVKMSVKAGNGYVYFYGDAREWPSVYVCRINHLSMSAWCRELRERIQEHTPDMSDADKGTALHHIAEWELKNA